MHLFPLLLLLAGCGGGSPPPDAQASAAPKKEKKKAKGKAPPAAPLPEPDVAGIPARAGELVGCPGGTKYTTQTGDDGTSAWCERPDGAKHGAWVRLHPGGERAEKGTFLDGKEDGQWSSWYAGEGEQLAVRGTWDHGKRIGRWIYWSESGKVKEEGDYLNGRRVGVWSEYDELGQPAKEGLYVNDLKDGKWTVYRPGEEKVVDHLEVWERGNFVGEAPAPPGSAPAPVPPTR